LRSCVCCGGAGLGWREGYVAPLTIKGSSISAARSRLSWPVFKALQKRACVPMAQPKTCPLAFYQGQRVVAMDGSNFELADEPENAKAFGYPGSRTGVAGHPQAQCAVLVECGTHAIIDANLGAYRVAEWDVCKPLLASLDGTVLCLADRGFNGTEYWRSAAATGAQLLWRSTATRQLPMRQTPSDGSYLSWLMRRGDPASAITVRVIEYALPNADGELTRYRLVTSLLDEKRAPALELAALYHERWEVEGVFAELKTRLLHRRRVLRSKTPDLVRQEFYVWVLVHYAVRWLMHAAATQHELPPRKLSFDANVQLLRRTQPQSGAFPPNATATA